MCSARFGMTAIALACVSVACTVKAALRLPVRGAYEAGLVAVACVSIAIITASFARDSSAHPLWAVTAFLSILIAELILIANSHWFSISR